MYYLQSLSFLFVYMCVWTKQKGKNSHAHLGSKNVCNAIFSGKQKKISEEYSSNEKVWSLWWRQFSKDVEFDLAIHYLTTEKMNLVQEPG